MAAKRQGGLSKAPARHNVVDGLAGPHPKVHAAGNAKSTKSKDTSHGSTVDGLARPKEG